MSQPGTHPRAGRAVDLWRLGMVLVLCASAGLVILILDTLATWLLTALAGWP